MLMVTCDKCHRKFSSYAALEQHYDRKHFAARRPVKLESGLAAERESASKYRPVPSTRGNSRVKIAVFLLVIILAVGLIGYVVMTPPQQEKKSVGVGSLAPDFTLPDTTGGTFTLSEMKAKSSVLLFFNEGLACSPCLDQMRNLDRLNSQLTGMNIVVASVTTDQMSYLTSWSQSSGPRYSSVLSDQSLTVSRAYDMLGSSMHPGQVDGHSFVLIDKSGVVTWRHDYYPPSMSVPNDQLLAAIRQATGA